MFAIPTINVILKRSPLSFSHDVLQIENYTKRLICGDIKTYS